MKEREHFMKPEMLQSQFATLEPPEHALTVDVAKSPRQVVAEIRQKLGL
jgi:gluconate kinase